MTGIIRMAGAAALLGALAHSPAPPASSGTPPRRPNIVLVVLDTLRRDATGGATATTGGAPWPRCRAGLTPHLDGLAARSTVFSNAYSTSPWTAPSHASMFTGLLPSEHNCGAARPQLSPAIPTLASRLADAGYETAAFYSNPWLSDEATGLLRGFQIREKAPVGTLRELRSGSGDQGGDQTLLNVAGWLERRRAGKPFFLFVNFLEAHLPYDPPASIRARFDPPLPAGSTSIDWAHEFNAGLHGGTGADWARIRGLYAGDVRRADELLGRLLDRLETAGVLKDAAVVVTSDHGENLGEHGLAEHQFSVHETLLAVPLVISLRSGSLRSGQPPSGPAPAGRLSPGRSTRPVMLTDLFATLAAVGGVTLDPPPRHSLSLIGGTPAAADPDRPVFAEDARPHRQLIALMKALNPRRDLASFDQAWRTVRVGSLRLTIGSGGTMTLHDLASDPTQERDLAAERQDVLTRLGGLINTLPAPAPAAPPDPALDEETRRTLRSLGYVQ